MIKSMGTYRAYGEKLKDPRWQRKRLEIYGRDNFACQECLRMDKTLNVHHLKYGAGDPWDVPDKWLITLCDDCHKAEEAMKYVDLYEIAARSNLTRRHVERLLEHVSYVLHVHDDQSTFWALHDHVMQVIVPDSDLTVYMDYLRTGGAPSTQQPVETNG